MSIKLIDDSTLVDIGNAIREKNYSATKYKPSEMSAAIRALEGGESNAVLVGVIDGSITEITIPSEVTEIRNYAFYCYNNLVNIIIPDSVTSIGDYAFYECSNLTNVTIGDSVTSIGRTAFGDCSSLINVIIGSGITMIERYLFDGCTSLALIDFRRATAVPTLASSNAFTNVPSACLCIIPDELYDEWTNTTNWNALSITYIKQSEYENGSATITDLTDTTWVFNDTITSFPSVVTDYAINFISYVNTVPSNEFESLKLMPAGNIYYIQGSYWPIVYNSSGWVDTQSKTISIIGGADATNADLIAWLQENAERSIVSFIIDGNTYEAYEGMTWQQWVNSAFNTAGFTIKDDMVYNSSNKYLFDHGGIIISDYYILEGEYYFDNL